MEHLAIMSKGYIKKICNGTKTIESRFSMHRIAPFHKASAGELVYMKECGKNISAVFEIEKVLYFEHLTPEKVEEIKKEYGDSIHAEPSFWTEKKHSNYATLLFIKHPREISPIKIYNGSNSYSKSFPCHATEAFFAASQSYGSMSRSSMPSYSGSNNGSSSIAVTYAPHAGCKSKIFNLSPPSVSHTLPGKNPI